MGTKIRLPKDRPVELHAEVPQGELIEYDLDRLLSAFELTDPSRIAVEAVGRRAIITIYPSNPLAQVRAVTRADLTMDRQGRIVVGVHHNGRLVRKKLFDFRTGSAQRFITFGTTGAGKSRVLQLQLIAEKVNGIVSWVADLKGGQSVPEARDQVDWFGDSRAEAMLMLRAAKAVALDRMNRYSAAGRTAFLWGAPDVPLHVHIEEANRLLDEASPYRDEAAALIRELGRTGRSVGVGVSLNAQASHLEDLGGSDTMRAMLREGEVTLLRWSSSMMKQLASDGLLPPGVQLAPIGRHLEQARLVSQFDDVADDGEDGAEGTQGMAYLMSSPHPASVMRHFRCGSIEPLGGLDPEILALYGSEEPARLETESHTAAGLAYRDRHDRAAMAVLTADVAEQAEDGDHDGTPASTAAPTVGTPHNGPKNGPSKASKVAKPLLADRVAAALDAAEGPMTAADVLAAVNADGGRQVQQGSVRNALGSLVEDGRAARAEHDRGLYVTALQPAT